VVTRTCADGSSSGSSSACAWDRLNGFDTICTKHNAQRPLH
jgi:hypothetical protein